MEIFIGIQLDYKNVLNTIIKEYLMGFKELLEYYSGFCERIWGFRHSKFSGLYVSRGSLGSFGEI